ncbi:MAG: YaiI/YqxD family protein [Luminiphilus sp.]
MEIWVDADACPGVIREIIAKAAHKRAISTTFVANHSFSLPNSPYVRLYQVPSGFDEADKEIERRANEGDLVITSDIPLASDVLRKAAVVLTPRGERYSENNIKQRLQMRDFMETMRSSGEHTGGPSALSLTDRKNFSDQLDRLLTRTNALPDNRF